MHRTHKVVALGAGAFVHELHAKGHDLKSIAQEVQDRYHATISYGSIKRFLDANPVSSSQGEAAAKAQDAITRIGSTKSSEDIEYWNGVLRLAASGLLRLLGDPAANARARAMAGQTLIDAAEVGTKQAEMRMLIEARDESKSNPIEAKA